MLGGQAVLLRCRALNTGRRALVPLLIGRRSWTSGQAGILRGLSCLQGKHRSGVLLSATAGRKLFTGSSSAAVAFAFSCGVSHSAVDIGGAMSLFSRSVLVGSNLSTCPSCAIFHSASSCAVNDIGCCGNSLLNCWILWW